MRRSFRVRLYPTAEHEQVLSRSLGCVRVWN
ncbi:helix-turn-helix domain-containing protein [Glycomyces sp. YM15]